MPTKGINPIRFNVLICSEIFKALWLCEDWKWREISRFLLFTWRIDCRVWLRTQFNTTAWQNEASTQSWFGKQLITLTIALFLGEWHDSPNSQFNFKWRRKFKKKKRFPPYMAYMVFWAKSAILVCNASYCQIQVYLQHECKNNLFSQTARYNLNIKKSVTATCWLFL